MICPDCSKEIEDNILYCPYCGYQLKKKETTEYKDLKIKALEQKIADLKTKPNNNRNELANLRNEIFFMRSQLDSDTGENKGNGCKWCCIIYIIISVIPMFLMPFLIRL